MTADIGSKGLQHTQPTQHSQTINPASQDLEFSGQLNRASHQGANFALLLASLQQDVLARPHVGKGSEPSNQQVDDIQSNYPEIHLQTHAQDWPLADTTTHILHSDGIRGAQLWLACTHNHYHCITILFILMTIFMQTVIVIPKRAIHRLRLRRVMKSSWMKRVFSIYLRK